MLFALLQRKLQGLRFQPYCSPCSGLSQPTPGAPQQPQQWGLWPHMPFFCGLVFRPALCRPLRGASETAAGAAARVARGERRRGIPAGPGRDRDSTLGTAAVKKELNMRVGGAGRRACRDSPETWEEVQRPSASFDILAVLSGSASQNQTESIQEVRGAAPRGRELQAGKLAPYPREDGEEAFSLPVPRQPFEKPTSGSGPWRRGLRVQASAWARSP